MDKKICNDDDMFNMLLENAFEHNMYPIFDIEFDYGYPYFLYLDKLKNKLTRADVANNIKLYLQCCKCNNLTDKDITDLSTLSFWIWEGIRQLYSDDWYTDKYINCNNKVTKYIFSTVAGINHKSFSSIKNYYDKYNKKGA